MELFTSESGKLALTTSARYTNISLLVLATENNTNVAVTFKFSDGSTQVFNSTINDWFTTTTAGVVIQGFGRIKRKAGPFAAGDYEGGGVFNPHMYSLEYSLPCSKSLDSIFFKNNSSTVITGSNRAFIFAVSGVTGSTINTPTLSGTTLCNPGSTTLTVQSPQAGVLYNWYTSATGGFAFYTGTTYTTPVLNGSTTYYIEAAALNGCAGATRVPVTVTFGVKPDAPQADSVNVCPGSTATIVVRNPVTGINYTYYTTATGGTSVGTGTSFTTPVINASTIYYIEAVNATTGCVSTTRTAVRINFLPKLATPTVTSTVPGVSTATFTWTGVTGAIGYQVSVNNGAFQTPSSGATGLTHTATGLAPLTNVIFRVKALGPQICQNSDSAVATTRTLTDEIYIPNVFTPNGDGKNDVFKAYSNIVSGIDMKIFDQWGESIFSSTIFSTGWDGSYKGKQQPVGVYVYVMKLTLTDGREVLKKGSVNLVR
jgi:gliding motility-associated-like protein